MTTSIETMQKADWDQLKMDVVTRIRLLKAAAKGLESNPLSDKIAQEQFLPSIAVY